MKTLYESLLTGKVSKPSAKVQPRSRDELEQIIDEHIKEIKPRPGEEVNLNWIDISRVDNLSFLFEKTNYIPIIDKWKIDHVKHFGYMFEGNTYITSSPLPVLQKKLLVIECYKYMFYGCTSLVNPPELPAMKLKKSCYENMFQYCNSLVNPPELPAKELEEWCYYSMFLGCESLVNPPELPAKKLAQCCYWYMFAGCTSLKNKAKTPFDEPIDTYYAYDMYSRCPKIKD